MGRTRTAGPQRSPKLAGAVPRIPGSAELPDWVSDVVGIGLVTVAGGALAYKAMELLGPTVIKQGPVIDDPIYQWTVDHQVKWWAAVMEKLTKLGNSQPSWGAAGAAGIALAAAWPQRKWVPPAALGAAFVVERFVTVSLRRKFGRLGPPSSPLGTYPSGGVDRVVYLYGLIAYLLWREFSGSPQGKALAIGAVAALSFNEAYSREYLVKHWTSDILSGLGYGAILLVPSIAAVRVFAGPAVRSAPPAACG